MNWTEIPAEQTTAVTDFLLAISALWGILALRQANSTTNWQMGIWTVVLILLAVAAFLGALSHGFNWSRQIQSFFWYPINLSLGILIGLFLVVVVSDLWGQQTGRRVLPLAVMMGIGFFIYSMAGKGDFLAFIIYQGVVMVFALGGYSWLAVRRLLEGADLVALGIFLTLLAAGIQATRALSFTFIWVFDHNGIYHLVQILAIVILVSGVRKGLQPQRCCHPLISES